MSLLQRIVYVTDILIPLIAIIFNVYLLWLIKTVKTKTIIHINYSLVPNSVIDIFVAFVTFVVGPHVFHVGGNFYLIFGDLFGSFSYYTACHLAALFGGLTMTNMISITASFYIRYLVICRNRTLSIRTMIAPYFIVFAIFLAFYLLFLWFYLSAVGNFETSILTNFWKEEYSKSPLFVANKILSFQFLTICGFLITVFISAYFLIFYFSKQISQRLRTHIAGNNSGTKLLHRQIQRTLFIQAIGPSLIGSMPFLLILLKSFFNLRSTQISLVLSFFFPWASLGNPIAAFIFIRPYRNYIIRMLKSLFNPFRRKPSSKTIITFTVPVRTISRNC